MIEILSKLRDQISVNDISSLVNSQVREGDQIEFKETLPTRKGQDPWINGKGNIGDYAKKTILEEVVAFANAYGGALVLGIEESGKKPSFAATISPISKCLELAERFELVFRDCVEPQLPSLEVLPIPINSDRGVVIFRTGRSYLAPHRVTVSKVCPIRRSDRCEELTMREIQEMTLNLSRGQQRLEKVFVDRSERFKCEFNKLRTPDNAFGVRMTAVPVVDHQIRINGLISQGGLSEHLRKPLIEVRRNSQNHNRQLNCLRNYHKFNLSTWQPNLRAVRASDSQEIYDRHTGLSGAVRIAYHEIHYDGLIEIGFLSNHSAKHPLFEDEQQLDIDSEVIVSIFAELVDWADHIRQQAQAPMTEYAINVEVRVVGGNIELVHNSAKSSPIVFTGTLKSNDTNFPIYEFADSEMICGLVASFERDLWNYAGRDFTDQQGSLVIECSR